MVDVIEVPLSPLELSERWRRMCVDPTFEDIPGKIEITQWGEILMSPVGKAHGLLAVSLSVLLMRKLGGRAMVEVGILTTAGIRAPDVAWVSKEKWENLSTEEQEKFPPIAPDFIIEVRSKSDSIKDLKNKMKEWIENGCQLAWLVDPVEQKAYIYKPGTAIEEISSFNQTVKATEVVPGFSLDLSKLKA